MTRKLLMIGIALVGFTLALGSNAWAGHARGAKRHKGEKVYHHNHKSPAGHHYGWEKGRGNPHRQAYRHRDRHPHYGKRVVERHVYHHTRRDDRRDDRFRIAVSVTDQFLGVAVAVSGSR